ncbi:hypothetical protein RsoPWM2_04 [Ralstonia phage vRsoP-WM2]|nr:hypothetical protein RsoPWM2_04 [Ralstonia phage vRsoP-WM2]
MYGNFDPSTNAWPFSVEFVDAVGWQVEDNRDPTNVAVMVAGLTFEEAKQRASELNLNHFRGS